MNIRTYRNFAPVLGARVYVDPAAVVIGRVKIGDYGLAESSARFNMLMGKGEAAARRAWLEEHGNETEADI